MSGSGPGPVLGLGFGFGFGFGLSLGTLLEWGHNLFEVPSCPGPNPSPPTHGLLGEELDPMTATPTASPHHAVGTAYTGQARRRTLDEQPHLPSLALPPDSWLGWNQARPWRSVEANASTAPSSQARHAALNTPKKPQNPHSALLWRSDRRQGHRDHLGTRTPRRSLARCLAAVREPTLAP